MLVERADRMDFFNYENGQLKCEAVAVREIISEVGTPCYIYSLKTVLHHLNQIRSAFNSLEPLICFSLKANSCGGILQRLVSEGIGFDVVSGGELFRALKAGAASQKIVYAGVGKTDGEIEYALDRGILMFNVESKAELENIDRIASKGERTARVALRVNPDVDPKTHAYITTGKKENKFGIDFETAGNILANAQNLSAVKIEGLHMHLGSQITKVQPHSDALGKVLQLADKAETFGVSIQWINIGGGFGIFYKGNEALPAQKFAEKIVPLLKGRKIKLIMEPGRFIVGNAGILATKVVYVKEAGKKFVICDSGMNHLIRPSLYGSYHKIWPVETTIEDIYTDESTEPPDPSLEKVDIVGPICESGDFFAKDRAIPPVARGDLLAIFSAGAYGMTMSSQYNSHPRPPEVVVDGSSFTIARSRETYEDLTQQENIVQLY